MSPLDRLENLHEALLKLAVEDEPNLVGRKFFASGGSFPVDSLRHTISSLNDLDQPVVATLLDDCWKTVQCTDFQQALGHMDGGERLHRRLSLLLSSAQALQAAYHLIALGEGENADSIASRLLAACRQSLEQHGVPVNELEEAKFTTESVTSPRRIVERAFRHLAKDGESFDSATFWTDYVLDPRYVAPAHEVTMPLVGYDSSAGGFFARLRFARYGSLRDIESGGSLIEHPEMELIDLGDELLSALHRAWSLFGYPINVSWRLNVDEVISSRKGFQGLDGRSLEAAAAVGFELLAKWEDPAPKTVVSAQIDPEFCNSAHDSIVARTAPLVPVEHIPEKLRAIADSEEFSVAVTAPASKAVARLKVLQVNTIGEAADAAAAMPRSEVRAYLNWAKQLPSRPAPPYLGGRDVVDIYVEPSVIVSRKVPDEETGHGQMFADEADGITQDSAPHSADDNYEEPDRTAHTKPVPWHLELKKQGSGFRGFVLGPPGQGKTLLAQMAFRERAKAASIALEQDVRHRGLELPLFVPLRGIKFSKAGNAREDIRAALSELFRDQLRDDIDGVRLSGDQCDELADYLSSMADSVSTLLILDGLDEVSETDPDLITGFLRTVAEWRCGILLTSRPHAVSKMELESLRFTYYQLAPFDDFQQMDFIDLWFPRDSDETDATPSRKRLESAFESAVIREMAGNPILLTLLCWQIERGAEVGDLARTDLYRKVVYDLLALRQGAHGKDVKGDAASAIYLAPILEEIACWFFLKNPFEKVGLEELLKIMLKSDNNLGKSPTPLQNAIDNIDKLVSKRVLVRLSERDTTEESDPGFGFPHRSIFEYLTAARLYRLIDEGGWDSHIHTPDGEIPIPELIDRNAWLPVWNEVMVFLAGLMAGEKGNTGDPVPLLETLAPDESGKDDLLRHRMALAVRCLDEIAPKFDMVKPVSTSNSEDED